MSIVVLYNSNPCWSHDKTDMSHLLHSKLPVSLTCYYASNIPVPSLQTVIVQVISQALFFACT